MLVYSLCSFSIFVDGPTTFVTYNNITYTPGQELPYLIFDENTQGPNILCSASGNLPPTVRWTRENGRGLPSGISQSVQSNGSVLLRWQRPMEFTDSGSYYCQASNNVRNISASVEILVESKFYAAEYCCDPSPTQCVCVLGMWTGIFF